MGGKSKTTQTTTLNDWSRARYDDLAGKIGGLLDQGGFTPFGGQLSAGQNAAEQQALQGVRELLGYRPQQVSAQSFTDADLSAYMNPYQQGVIDAALGDIERSRQMQRVSDSQSAAAAGAWGGSRHGVADALTNEAAQRQAANAAASLRADAFSQAANLFNQDRAARLQTDQFNSSLGLQGAQFGLGAAGLLGQLGAQGRQFEQAALDRQYAEFIRGQDALYKQAQGYLGLLGATPMLRNTTSSSKSGGGLLGYLKNNMDIAGQSITSDRRLKTDVRFVETDANGRRWYDFVYTADPERTVHRGVMAQDLLDENPNHPAVSTDERGYYVVNYGAL